MASETQVLVVGAGPYGIGIAQALYERGLEIAVVGEPFELWLGHTLGTMRLRSDRNASEIYSGDGRYEMAHFERLTGEEIPERMEVDTFRRYIHWVLGELPFPIHRGRVEHLEAAEGGLSARLDDGTALRARHGVLATGLGSHQRFPAVFENVPPEYMLHSWHTAEIEAAAEERVLVVGGGQSAAETVDNLRRRNNQVTWLLRREPSFFREPLRVPTPVFKLILRLSSLYYRLPSPILRTLSRLIFRTTVTPDLRPVYADVGVRKVLGDAADLDLSWNGASGNGTGIASGFTGERYDRIVSATGYRFSVAGLPFLGPQLVERLGGPHTVPALDKAFRTPVPEIYLAGGIAEGSFGPAQRFIMGSWPAARKIAQAIAGAGAR